MRPGKTKREEKENVLFDPLVWKFDKEWLVAVAALPVVKK